MLKIVHHPENEDNPEVLVETTWMERELFPWNVTPENVSSVTASDTERSLLLCLCTHIPRHGFRSEETTWYGDHAKFLISALRVYCNLENKPF